MDIVEAVAEDIVEEDVEDIVEDIKEVMVDTRGVVADIILQG